MSEDHRRLYATTAAPQRALVVAVDLQDPQRPLAAELAEFVALAKAAGASKCAVSKRLTLPGPNHEVIARAQAPCPDATPSQLSPCRYSIASRAGKPT